MFLFKLENHLNRVYRWNLKSSINKWDLPGRYPARKKKKSRIIPGNTNNYGSLKEEPEKGTKKAENWKSESVL